METKDGGPAFPHVNAMIQPDGSFVNLHEYGAVERGMSLRDHFAGIALPHCQLQCLDAHGLTRESDAADAAFDQADAMIAEKAKREGGDGDA